MNSKNSKLLDVLFNIPEQPQSEKPSFKELEEAEEYTLPDLIVPDLPWDSKETNVTAYKDKEGKIISSIF